MIPTYFMKNYHGTISVWYYQNNTGSDNFFASIAWIGVINPHVLTQIAYACMHCYAKGGWLRHSFLDGWLAKILFDTINGISIALYISTTMRYGVLRDKVTEVRLYPVTNTLNIVSSSKMHDMNQLIQLIIFTKHRIESLKYITALQH